MSTLRTELSRVYQELHEGLPASEFVREKPISRPGPLRELGTLTAIQYQKAVPEGPRGSGVDQPYKHPYTLHAQPTLWLDARGHLHLSSGRFVVTTHGIEDRPLSRVEREYLPSTRPRALVTLGKLEFIQYRNAATGRSETIAFVGTQRPILAHDPRGNALYALHGRYSIEVPQQETVMAKRRRRSRRNPTLGMFRVNPSGVALVKQAKAVAVSAAEIGVAVAGTMFLMSWLEDRPAVASRLVGKSPYIPAVGKALVGIAAGVALQKALPNMEGIGAAVATGGVASGAVDAVYAWQLKNRGTNLAALNALGPSQLPAAAPASGVFGVSQHAFAGR